MNPIRVILIDPIRNQITETEMEPTLREFYKALDCSTIEAVFAQSLRVSGHIIYCDEEGLLREGPLFLFKIKGYHQKIAGKAVIPKEDDGNEISCTLTMEEVAAIISFPPNPVIANFD
jgi:hypothetical protein